MEIQILVDEKQVIKFAWPNFTSFDNRKNVGQNTTKRPLAQEATYEAPITAHVVLSCEW